MREDGEHRDLSDADLRGADLRDADLSDADLRGADLRDADLRGAKLIWAELDGANLRGAKLDGANLRDAKLIEADLRDVDLSGADLSGADLRWANLTGTKLRGALGLPEAPVVPDLDARMAEVCSRGGVLDMLNWRTCGTTHCRGGWAVNLAGEAGAALERAVGPGMAAALIYAASTPDGYVPDFYAPDEEAISDIDRRARLAGAR